MAKCGKCDRKAAIVSTKPYCKEHFIGYFENKVIATIKKFSLISKSDKVIVGSSGGKDSTSLLYILQKYFKNVSAIAIDEGIPGYRNVTLEGLKRFCGSNGIPLQVYSYREEFGFTLTDAIKARKDVSPCSICGVLRRYLLNLKSRPFTRIATGHNLDDEVQSIMMNLMKAQVQLLSRLGPVSGNIPDPKFTPRVKPLYFCTEREVAAYAIIKNFGISFIQCPHSHNSFRAFVRDALNDYESKHKGAKLNLVSNFLQMLPGIKKQHSVSSLNYCSNCSEPSERKTCSACTVVKSITAIPAASH